LNDLISAHNVIEKSHSSHNTMKQKIMNLAAAAAITGAASAASIGVSFGGDNNGGTANGATAFLDPADTAGVVSQANWTNAPGISGSAVDVLNGSGAASSLDVSWGSGESWNWNSATNTSEGELVNGWLSTNTIGEATTLDVTEIPYATYDLYLYSGHDRDSTGSGSVYTLTEANSAFAPTTLIENVDPAALAADPFTYVNGTDGTGNYALWSGLTASELNISMTSTTNRMALSGFQIVAVPEPSSTILLSLSGLALFFRRRK
jgi:hypothetical protein